MTTKFQRSAYNIVLDELMVSLSPTGLWVRTIFLTIDDENNLYETYEFVLFLFLGEKLANEWEGHEVGLIAEVDCTSRSGKILCERFDIRSFPTLMYGDPGNLEEYEGSRKYEDLVEFARQNLVPLCSPTNLDLCSEEARSQIERYLAMSKDELQALVEAEENKLVEAKKKYDQEIEALQLKYEEAAQERDEALAAIREGGLEWMKSVSKAMNENSQRLPEAKTDEL